MITLHIYAQAGGLVKSFDRPPNLVGGSIMTLWTVMLIAATAAAAERSSWNLRDHIPLEAVTVQSHRGAGVLSPENSIEAFDIAWKLGTIPEADLRTSKDGVIVAFHDANF